MELAQINELATALDFFRENPSRWKTVMETFGDLSTSQLINISKNKNLYRKFMFHIDDRYKFSTLSAALECAKANENMILIYMTDLALYGVTSPEKYLDFASDFRDSIDGDEKFNPRQLILSDRKQKIVFIYTGSEQSQIELTTYVKEFLKSNIIIDEFANKTEITLSDITASNYLDAKGIFEKLNLFIYKKNRDMAYNMQIVKPETDCCTHYTEASISATINAGSIEELVKILKTVHSINNLTIFTGNTINGNINIGLTDEQANKATDWIRANPPNPMTGATEYRRACNTANRLDIGSNSFAKIMETEGYLQHRIAKHQTWRK